MSESESRLSLTLDSTKAERNAKSLGRELNTLDKSGGALTATVAKLSGVLASAFALDKTIRTVTAFQDSMLRLQATSNATTQAMSRLEKQSRTLGATSRFSAQQAAEAQNFLAMAGFKVNEILSATPSVMKFASAASLDLARSADIASNVLGGMQLPVAELDRVMNTMINTAQSANTNVSQMGEALAHAAPLAVTAGISIEQLAASIGVLGDSGIQGGRAGTGLVGVIRQLSLITPKAEEALSKYGISVEQLDIKANGLEKVLRTLKAANLSTADAIAIFGSEAAASGLILAQNVDRMGDLSDANDKAAGKLTEVANILDSGLSAAFASVNSAIEETMLQMGDAGLTKVAKVLTVTVAGVISTFNGMGESFAKSNGLSAEFARNINILTGALKIAGAVLGGYVVALALAKAGAIAGAAYNGVYAASLAAITGQAAATNASLLSMKTAYGVVGAAFTGWSIGTYLRGEFEVVEKAGIALMSGLHQAVAWLMGEFDVFSEKMKFALTNPLDFARLKIAEFLQWVAGFGTGLASALGFDVSGAEAQIAKGMASIRGTVATEHQKTINAMRAKNKAAIAEISDGYFQQFAAVGKATKLLESGSAGAVKATDKLATSIKTAGKAADGTAKATKDLAAELQKAIWDKFNRDAEEAKKRTQSLTDEFTRISDRLDPLSATTRAYAKEVAFLTDNQAALEEQGYNVTGMLTGLEAEYKKNVAATSQWAQMTQRAMDSVDSAFVDMWRNIGGGFESFADGLKNAFKNLLAEMAHMAITRPIMMQIGGMLGMGTGGGGAGDIIGSMMGGSKGGGTSFGSIASMGQSIYSAFTGWGKAAVAGWQSGGLSGAASGVGSYFGGGVQSLAGTVGGWFGGAGGGSAVSGGAGYMLNASGQVVNTAATGSLSSGGGAAASSMSNPIGWALAAILGSKSFYDAGYQLDHKQVANQTLSKVSFGIDPALSLALDGFMKGVQLTSEKILQPIFGEKWGNILSLGPLFSGVSNTVNKALFGGQWKTKSSGFDLGVSDGEFSGQQYQFSKKKKGLLGGGGKKLQYGALNDETAGVFQELYESTVDGVSGIYQALGIALTDASLSGFESARKQLNTMGATDEQVSEMLVDYFSGLSEELNKFFQSTLGVELNYSVEQMQEFVTGLLFVNHSLESLNLTAFAVGVAGGKSAESLIAMSGGLEGFGNAVQGYYASFVDTQDKLDKSIKTMRDSFESLDVTIPRTRDQFRSLVESLDLTDAASQETFLALMSLSGGMAEYYSALENLEKGFYAAFTPMVEKNRHHLMGLNAEFTALGQKMPNTRTDFIDLVNSFDIMTDSGEDMRRAMLQLAPAMNDYYSVLEQFAFNITGVSNSLSANIGGLRENIFLDQFDNEGKFNYAKAQADALAAMLPDLTDLGLIEQTTNDIIRLTQTAYGLLDEAGKKEQGAEFIQMLDELEALSRDRAAQAQLEQTEAQAQIMSDAMTLAAERMATSMEESMKRGAADQSAVAAMFDSIGQAMMNQFAALSMSRFGEVT